MFNRLDKRTYTTYLKRCEELKVPPVSWDDFKDVFRRQARAITYMLDVLKRDSPYIVSKIDDKMILYAHVKGEQVIVNVWSAEECQALTGLEA